MDDIVCNCLLTDGAINASLHFMSRDHVIPRLEAVRRATREGKVDGGLGSGTKNTPRRIVKNWVF